MSIRQSPTVAQPDAPLALEVFGCIKSLFGADAAIIGCRGGRNSRVYRIDRRRETYALKVYPADGRKRVEREYGALSFFSAAGIGRVPKPVARFAEQNCAVYTWLDGDAVGEAGVRDVDALASFAAELHALRERALPYDFDDAVEACADAVTVIRQIGTRLERLSAVSGEPTLQEFLSRSFKPVFARARVDVAKCAPTAPQRAQRTLSPSDFGFHNALRVDSRDLAFLDFEYFGWDDPIKLVSDVCWHPGMDLPRDLRTRFITSCKSVYGCDPAFEERLLASYPLYGLRWCLIVLNEFMPELWERRVAAGVDHPAAHVRRVQLQKAYGLLERVDAGLNGSSP
jgi:hypothetical protein